VSSDLHSHNVDGPAYDQATTLSKLMHAGMSLAEVITATTAAPAAAVRREGLAGTLAVGRAADLTVAEVRAGDWALPDAAGQTEVAGQLIVPRLAVRAGQVSTAVSPVPGLLAAGGPR
jgi:dihydroorotase